MITELDLQKAIAECQGVRDPTASTCIKLAAFLIIRREMFGEDQLLQNLQQLPAYSYASEPPETTQRYSGAEIGDYGDSDFLQTVKGKDPAAAWAVMDEVMDTLKVINARVYNATMRKLES